MERHMKGIVLGAAIGAALVLSFGFTYDVMRAGKTVNVVDVRLVELGGHEYVVASSCCQATSFSDVDMRTDRINKNTNVNNLTMNASGSSISVVHHVGCKACEGK